jgi:hypothetical protein
MEDSNCAPNSTPPIQFPSPGMAEFPPKTPIPEMPQKAQKKSAEVTKHTHAEAPSGGRAMHPNSTEMPTSKRPELTKRRTEGGGTMSPRVECTCRSTAPRRQERHTYRLTPTQGPKCQTRAHSKHDATTHSTAPGVGPKAHWYHCNQTAPLAPIHPPQVPEILPSCEPNASRPTHGGSYRDGAPPFPDRQPCKRPKSAKFTRARGRRGERCHEAPARHEAHKAPDERGAHQTTPSRTKPWAQHPHQTATR